MPVSHIQVSFVGHFRLLSSVLQLAPCLEADQYRTYHDSSSVPWFLVGLINGATARRLKEGKYKVSIFSRPPPYKVALDGWFTPHHSLGGHLHELFASGF